jgi:2-polyprenyl-6-methoxyphenol hydroxylase-like FAD-dependent oxidoreductase
MIHTPVLIVGGGPVGLNLALNLAWWDTPCLLVNDNENTPNHPQGNSHNARTMEHYRRLGIANTIRKVGLPPDHCGDAIFVTRINSYEIGRIKLPTNRERVTPGFSELDITPEPTHRASQMYVEAILKEHAQNQSQIDLRFGCRMLEFSDNEDHVVASIEQISTGEMAEINCKFMVACDGANSSIRKALNINYEGKSAEEVDFMMGQMLSVYFYAPELYKIMKTDAPWQFHTVNADGRTSIVGLDGEGKFVAWAKVPSGMKPEEMDLKSVIYAAIGEPIDVEIISAKPWTAGLSLVANSYCSGSILMSGDAVHLFTPTGGFGMNTGVDDAANLAWKLAALYHGWGGPNLVASYEKERRPIAVRNLAQSYALAEIKSQINVPEGVEDNTASGDSIRTNLGRRFMIELAEEYKCIGIQLGAQYMASPLIEYDGSEQPCDDPYVFHPSACPGCRSPHSWLEDGTALFDQFGKWFTLLRFNEKTPVNNFVDAASRMRVPLKVLTAPKDINNLYQADLILIRPDQYVAWRDAGHKLNAECIIGKAIGH